LHLSPRLPVMRPPPAGVSESDGLAWPAKARDFFILSPPGEIRTATPPNHRLGDRVVQPAGADRTRHPQLRQAAIQQWPWVQTARAAQAQLPPWLHQHTLHELHALVGLVGCAIPLSFSKTRAWLDQRLGVGISRETDATIHQSLAQGCRNRWQKRCRPLDSRQWQALMKAPHHPYEWRQFHPP